MDFPAWDFWRWDENGNYLYQLDYEPPQSWDIRFGPYDVNIKKWIYQRYYWTAAQAAALSYCRDPEGDPAEGSWMEDSWYGDHLRESERLRQTILDLKEVIEGDQAKGLLTPDFFPIEMYFEWASRKGIFLPPFYRDHIEKKKLPPGSDDEPKTKLAQNAPEPPLASSGKPTSQQIRAENTTLKILYAVIKDKHESQLAQTIDAVLREIADKKGDSSFAPSIETIMLRIRRAHDLAKL